MTLVRYIVRELLAAFIVTFGGLTAIAVAGSLLQMYRHLAGQGLDVLVAGLPAVVGFVAPWTLLVSVVIAGTLVMSRLSSDGELEAMRTSGVSLALILRAALLPTLLFCVCALALTTWITPKAYEVRWALLKHSFNSLLHDLPRGRQIVRIGPYLIQYQDALGTHLERPYIVVRSRDGIVQEEYVANRGEIVWESNDRPRPLLYEAYIFRRRPDGTEEDGYVDRGLGPSIPLDDIATSQVGDAGRSMEELWREGHTSPDPWGRNARSEFHLRIATGLAPLALMALALGLGMTVPRAAKLGGLGVSLPALGGFLVLHLGGSQWGEGGTLPAWLGAYVGVAAGVVVGAALIVRQVRR